MDPLHLSGRSHNTDTGSGRLRRRLSGRVAASGRCEGRTPVRPDAVLLINTDTTCAVAYSLFAGVLISCSRRHAQLLKSYFGVRASLSEDTETLDSLLAQR